MRRVYGNRDMYLGLVKAMKVKTNAYKSIGDEPWLDGYTPPYYI